MALNPLPAARSARRIALVVVAVAAVVCLGGCSSSSKSTASKGGCTTAVDGKLTITADNMMFDTDCLKAMPGELTVTFHNKQTGVAHNFHLEGATPKVADEDRTVLRPGDDTQSVTYVDLKPGTYTYVCDIHASTMRGTLTVAAASGSSSGSS